jgi:methionyl-tRNA formyltransferase
LSRIALLGSPGNPTVGLFHEALVDAGFVVSVVRNNKHESDKDMRIWEQRTGGRLPPVPLNGLQIIEVDRISSPTGAEVLSTFDLAINGGCIEIIKPIALNAPRLGILNIHPGILPKYRGCCAVEWSLHSGDPVGVTAHLMDASIDTGPIVAIKHVDVTLCRDYQDIRIAAFRASFGLAAEAARSLLEGRSVPKPQGEGTYWKPIDDERLARVIAAAKRAS